MELQYLLYLMSRMIVGSQTWCVDTSFDHISHVSHLMRLVVIWLLQCKESMLYTINGKICILFLGQNLEFNTDISISSPSSDCFGPFGHFPSSCVLEVLCEYLAK